MGAPAATPGPATVAAVVTAVTGYGANDAALLTLDDVIAIAIVVTITSSPLLLSEREEEVEEETGSWEPRGRDGDAACLPCAL